MTADFPDRPVSAGELRVSDADREDTVERLREAAGEGRLDLEELEERLELALKAKTFRELAGLTADLPSAGGGVEHADEPLVFRGGMGGVTRTGAWDVASRISAYGGMGGVKLDFTRVVCRLPEIEVEAHGEMAGVTLVLPADWAADTNGLSPGMAGVKDKTTAERAPGTPRVRVVGTGGAGGVVVRHPNAWERRKAK